MNLKMFCSSIHYLECDFYLQDFFFFVAVFHNINAPHWWKGLGGGGGGVE